MTISKTLSLLCAAAGVAAAEEPETAPRGVAVDRTRDGIFTAALAWLWYGNELIFTPLLAPDDCRWCDDDLNAFDTAFRNTLIWSDDNRDTATTLSHVGIPSVLVVMVGSSWLFQRDTDLLIDDSILMLQAGAITAVVVQVGKYAAGRSRPDARFGGRDEGDYSFGDHPNLSFPSGHTAFASAVVAAGATSLALRGQQHSWPLVATLGGGLALGTGYLTVAADRHYATDVLAGAFIGATVGVGTVWIHRERRSSIRVVAAPRSIGVIGSF